MSISHFSYYIRNGRCPPYEVRDGVKFFDARQVATWKPDKRKRGRKKLQSA